MNIQAIARDLVRYIGITSLDPAAESSNINARTIIPADLAFVAGVINGSLQEIFALGPRHLREREIGGVLRAPTTVTLTCTQFSTTISALTTYAAWMLGCTIRIAGDTQDNQIISSTELLRPFMGSSASAISATVYADAIKLDSTHGRVLDPVYIPTVRALASCTSKEHFRSGRNHPDTIEGWANQASQNTIGEPLRWMAEARYDGSTEGMPIYLRVNPMPSTATALTYTVKVKPTAITAENIGDEASNPDVTIPLDWVESILLPFARKRMMAHAHFDGTPAVINQINLDYKMATMLLSDTAPHAAMLDVSFQR